MKNLSIIIGVIAILGFIILFTFEVLKYNKTGAKKYNFLNSFPFELNCFRLNQKISWVFAVSLIVLSLSVVFPFLAFAIINTKNSIEAGIRHVISCYLLFFISLISVSSFVLLNFIKLSNYRWHIICDAIFITSTMCLDILMMLLLGTTSLLHLVIRNEIRVLIVIIGILILIFLAILMLNPTYKNWSKMMKYDADSYERPKYSYLCMLEWGVFLSLILLLVPLYLAMFF